MEKNNKFRNHISVVLENCARQVGAIAFILIINIAQGIEDIGGIKEQMPFTLGLAVLMIFLIVIQLLLWAKTYIYIDDNSLVIERNTIFRKKNTIGLKNISNVNLEQNIFEMVVGTCKLKLDTNSLSTANETDVKIVLKKDDAEAFKKLVLGQSEQPKAVTDKAQEEDKDRLESSFSAIMMHGIFSIKFWSLAVVVVLVVMEVSMLVEMIQEGFGESVMEMLIGAFSAFWVMAGLLWSMVKEFVKYIGFVIDREDDKVLIRYGLFKKVSYAVPVDKINGLVLMQTPLARLGKRYMVEIVNVGISDDTENEAHSFFLPYGKKEDIKQQLHLLLPEFDGCLDIEEEKQPKCIWLFWLPYVLILILGAFMLGELAMTYVPDMDFWAIVGAAAAVLVFLFVCKLASYLTAGIAVDEKFLKLVQGSFIKKTLFVKYDKIQMVITKQQILAKHFGVQKGNLFLLSSMKNLVHAIPFCKDEKIEEIKEKLI